MVGAQPCLEQEFGLTKAEAGKVLVDWMMTFDRDKTLAERVAMVAKNRIRAAEVEANCASIEARYARYFRFCDQLRPTDCRAGSWIDALIQEFGIGEGEAHGAYYTGWSVPPTAGRPSREPREWEACNG